MTLEGKGLPYSAKFLRVFNFANFANFQPFAKIFQRKFLTCGMQCAHATNSRNYFNEITIRKYLDPRKFSAIRYVLISHILASYPGSRWAGERESLVSTVYACA